MDLIKITKSLEEEKPIQEKRWATKDYLEREKTNFLIDVYGRGITSNQAWKTNRDIEYKKSLRKTIKRNIQEKYLNYKCDITLDPRKRPRDVEDLKQNQNYMRQLFKALNIDYVFMPEIHPLNGEGVHFHGFIRISNKKRLERKYWAKNGKTGPIFTYGKPVFTLKELEDKLGFTTIVSIEHPFLGIQATTKQVNYIIKYATKSNHGFKLMSSRPIKNRKSNEIAKKLFGDILTFKE